MRDGSDPTAKALGTYVTNKLYGPVVDMFVFGCNNSGIVAVEEILYVLVDW